MDLLFCHSPCSQSLPGDRIIQNKLDYRNRYPTDLSDFSKLPKASVLALITSRGRWESNCKRKDNNTFCKQTA